jgi:hypothetical protein
MLGATLKMAGQPDIVGTNVVWVDATSFTVDFDLADAALGLWDVVCTHDECDKTATLPAAFEVTAAVFDIHYFDTSPIGAGVTPAPASGMNSAVDVACRPNDGAFYMAWSNTSAPSSGGYVVRYDATGASTLMSAYCYGAGGYATTFSYSHVNMDAGTVGGRNGWSCLVDPVVNYGNDETNTDGANDSYGYWYGSPLWFIGGSTNAGNGNVYSYCVFNYYGSHYRAAHECYTAGSWSNTAYSASLNIAATDFDGAETYPQNTFEQRIIRAVSAATDQNTLFGLFKDAPHVRQYGNWMWYTYGATSFGVEGTADGEIKTPRDMSFRMSGNRMYVLDEPTDGKFRVQCFDTAGNWIATSGEQSCSTYGATHPYKMDYNDIEDCIYLLLDNNKIIGLIDDSI